MTMASEPLRGPAPQVGVAMDEERERLTAAQVAAIANPASLGLAALALPLFLWGVIFADFFDRTSAVMFLIPVGLVYGGLTQALAGMWAFRKHEPLLATLFGTFGAFWLSYAVLLWMENARFLALGTEAGDLYGLFFVGWAIPAVSLLIAMLRHNGALALLLTALAAAFIAAAVGFATDTDGWKTAAGATVLSRWSRGDAISGRAQGRADWSSDASVAGVVFACTAQP